MHALGRIARLDPGLDSDPQYDRGRARRIGRPSNAGRTQGDVGFGFIVRRREDVRDHFIECARMAGLDVG